MRTPVSALAIAGIVAVGLLALASRQNPSVLLRLIMAAWVLAPLVALACLSLVWTPRPLPVLTAWARACWAVAITYLIVFGLDAVRPLSPKRALPYVVVPLLAWLVVTVTGAASWLKRARQKP